MHKRILKSEKWDWYCRDVGLPYFILFAITGIIQKCIKFDIHPLVKTCQFSLLFALLIIIGILSANQVFPLVSSQTKKLLLKLKFK